jgi:hypothetical protein
MVRTRWIETCSIVAVFVFAGALGAQDNPQGVPPKEQRVAAGEKEARKLLLLMDKDQNGKVSKEEFMRFMEAEFERLDVNKDGELDVKELTKSQVRVSRPVHRSR